jgi:hypothetical protein
MDMKRNLVLMAALVAVVLVLSCGKARAQSAAGESWSSCTDSLCIDAPPQGPGGADGSGGWGWSNTAKAPVSVLTVGTASSFTVTVLDPTVQYCGSGDNLTITLTYSSYDFTLSSTDSRANVGANPFDRGGVMTFTYAGDFLCHTDQSVAYTFTPMNPDPYALVTATVSVGGQQVSETFPVAILKPVKHR